MFFSVSGITVNPFIPFGVAFVVSFFTSMGGVSGAFLLLPFQMSVLGYTTPSVSGTNQVFNIVAIPSGVYRYIREGRMLWPLTWAVIIGTLPGVIIGALIRIKYLPDPKNFKFFVGLVLLYIGLRLLSDIVKNKVQKKKATRNSSGTSCYTVNLIESTLKRVAFAYDGEVYSFSPTVVYLICFLVGIVGGVYGIGGGAIIAPFFITIIRLPVYAVAGATLMGTFITSITGAIIYQVLSWVYSSTTIAPDFPLGLLFGLGGVLGMYLGARTQKYIPAGIIKVILCGCVLFVSIRYVTGVFM